MERLLEISDVVWPLADDGHAVPVRRDDALASLRRTGQHRAARVVAAMPHRAGVLDEDHLAALAVRVHAELGRLGEELQLAARICASIGPRVDALAGDHEAPVTVVDVGCGLGHLLRTVAARGLLPPGVELVGVDLNPFLVAHARDLAATEGLAVRFVVGDAVHEPLPGTDPARTVVMSSGLLHHLDRCDLPALFAAHARAGVAGFSHWDIAPGPTATIGAWVFHQARMREPVSRHDGVVSARRGHPSDVLAAAAEAAAGYDCTVVDEPTRLGRALQVLRPVEGWRR